MAEKNSAAIDASWTQRRDTWWVEPLLIISTLGGFLIYTGWAAFQGAHYHYQNYLSPFYPPFNKPAWWALSPAFLILWAPAGFRLTCYYFRRAFYRSFWWAPPACAVRDAHVGYGGETGIPLILMNVHRYFLYLAMIELAVLWYDTVHGFIFNGRFGLGVGSLVMITNVSLLTLYLTSCHSFRHLIGGRLNRFSACPTQHAAWKGATCLNERHMLWFWLSLLSVGLTDLYIRLLSMGVITDLRII